MGLAPRAMILKTFGYRKIERFEDDLFFMVIRSILSIRKRFAIPSFLSQILCRIVILIKGGGC